MLAWVSSLWLSEGFSGAARNAPNNGINIKTLFDQRPKQVMTVSEEEVRETLKSLKKTVINAVPPLSQKPPIMAEFDEVFTMGHKEYFERKRLNRLNKVKNQAEKVPIVEVKEVEICEEDNTPVITPRQETDLVAMMSEFETM